MVLAPQLLLDSTGKVVYVNEAFLKWSLLELSSILYYPFTNLIETSFGKVADFLPKAPFAIKELDGKTLLFRNNRHKILEGECAVRVHTLLNNTIDHVLITIKVTVEDAALVIQDNTQNGLQANLDYQHYKILFQQLPYAIVVFDAFANGRVYFQNKSYSDFIQSNESSSAYFMQQLTKQANFRKVFRAWQTDQETAPTSLHWEGVCQLVPQQLSLLKIIIQRGTFLGNPVHIYFIEDRTRDFLKFEAFDKLNAKVRQAEELLGFGMWEYNLKTKEIHWSEGIAQLLGLPNFQGQPKIKNFLDHIHPNDVQSFMKALDRSIQSKRFFKVNFRIHTINGDYLLVQSKGKVYHDIELGQSILAGTLQLEDESDILVEQLTTIRNQCEEMMSLSNIGWWEWEVEPDRFQWKSTCNPIFGIQEEHLHYGIDTLLNLIPDFERRQLKNLLLSQTRSSEIQEFNCALRTQKNVEAYYLIKLMPSLQIEGEPPKVVGILKEITAVKTIEDELLYYRYLVHNVTDAIIATTADLKIKTWSKAAEKIYGWQADEVIGKSLKRILFSDYQSPQFFRNFSKKMVLTGEWRGQLKQSDKEGNLLTIQSSARLMKDSHGSLLGLVMVNRNLTDFIEVSQKAKAYGQRLELMFENTSGSIILLDTELNIEGHNSNFSKIIGSSYQDLVGKSLHDLEETVFLSEDAMLEQIKAVIKNGNPVYHIKQSVKVRHAVLWLESDFIPIKTKSGKVTGVLCTTHDVTERIQFETKLREKEANFVAIIENANYALCYVDVHYRLKAYNSAFKNLFTNRFGKEVSDNCSFMALLSESWKEQLLEVFQYVSLGQQLTTEREMIVGKQEVWFEFACNPVISEHVVIGFCLSIRDISTRKQNEQLMLESRIQQAKIRSHAIIQGQEEERNRISMELHDGVGQILTALQMQSNYIQNKSFTPEELNQKLQRLDELVSATKQEIRRISFNLMPRMLKDFGLQEAIKGLCSINFGDSSNCEVEQDLQLGEQRYEFDIEVGTFRVVQEIFNNILKHSSASRVLVKLMHTTSSLLISVIDNGKGFDYQKVFNSKKEKNGLKNINHRVSMLGGQLSIKTKPNEGCAYSIVIPARALSLQEH